MPTITAAGTTLLISASIPPTHDLAGFDGVAFVEIGGVESIGAIGPVTAKVEFRPLRGPTQKHKGATDYGSLVPSIAIDGEDAGQALLQTAGEPANNDLYAFAVVYPNQERRYFLGRVFGYPETVGGADSIILANPTVEICTSVIKYEPYDGNVPENALVSPIDGRVLLSPIDGRILTWS